MSDKELKIRLKGKLEEIAGILCDSTDKFNSPGILAGVSGLALFMFYYSRFTGDSKYAAVGEQALEKAVEMINNGFTNHTFCSGISGLAWTCEHLEQNGFIDRAYISFLNDLDPYFLYSMEKDFGAKNYDFLHGGLGVSLYFLKKSKPDNMKNKVTYLRLKETAIMCNNGCFKWESSLSDTGRFGFNISLSHGMSSIVVILSKLFKLYPHVVEIRDILQRTIEYILQQQLPQVTISFFPSYSLESDENPVYSRLGWCYGDLGVAQAIQQASETLNNSSYKDQATMILLHNCKRNNLQENHVRDAAICHGTSGIAHAYNRLYERLKKEEFNEAAHFWMEKTLEMAYFRDGLAGFKSWQGKKGEWENVFPLLEGISGIGLSILSYLNPKLMNWDECILLS